MLFARKIVFLLAHQDDEIFCLHLFHFFKNAHFTFIYLTDGATGGKENIKIRRIKELEEAINYIAPNSKVIQFGLLNNLEDGKLALSMNKEKLDSLTEVIENIGTDHLVSPFLEGGHQDHDAVFLITKYIAQSLNISQFSFPMYSAAILPFPFFKVMSKSEKHISFSVNFRERVGFVRTTFKLMGIYKSQKNTWLILGIPVLLKYIFTKPIYFEDDDCNLSSVKKYLFETRGTFSKEAMTDLIRMLD